MATLEDVAKLCGLSAMTVSRVINHKPRVSEATQKKVYAAIEQLGYHPNLIAKSLATRRSHTVGVVMNHLENPLYSLIVAGLAHEATERGYDVLISTFESEKSAERCIRNLIGKRIDGIVLLPVELLPEGEDREASYGPSLERYHAFTQSTDELLRDHREKGLISVSIGNRMFQHADGYVDADYEAGAYMAVRYLAEKGHTRIGYLCMDNEGIWQQRNQGFERAMGELALHREAEDVQTCYDTIHSAYKAMCRLMQNARVTGVFCANDVIAAGAVSAALSLGLRIPEDISIIGHDNSLYSEAVYPSLTTVSIQPYRLGAEAFRIAHSGICGQTPESVWVPPALIERRSVRCLQR